MMNDEPEALRRYLDGEIGRDELPDELLPAAEEFERAFGALDREPVRLPASVADNIMERVRAPEGRPARFGSWLVTPFTLRVRPAAVLALAAAVIVVVFASPRIVRSPASSAPVALEPVTAVARFVFDAPAARQVAVTGEFVGWNPQGIAMNRRDDGAWVAEVVLPPGVHQYVFVVDGVKWVPDPAAMSQVDDGFGQKNSVMVVVDPQS